MSTGRRGKKDFYLLYALKPQNLGAYMCAVRKADTHIRLRAASSEGLGVGAQVAGTREKSRPWKRMAKLELEGLDCFWITWKIRSNLYEGLQICPIIITSKPSIQWEELQQSRREAGDSIMLIGGVGDNRKVAQTTPWGGRLGQELWAEL